MKWLNRYLLLGALLLPGYAWPSEAGLRVAFVYNFIKFIEWPSAGLKDTIRLCALGADSDVRRELTKIRGMAVNKQTIELFYLDASEDIAASLHSCQMVYRPLSSNLKTALPDVLPEGVLLVADEAKQEEANVSISLVRSKEGRIEFTINRSSVESSGVMVSSQLLKLAKNTSGTL